MCVCVLCVCVCVLCVCVCVYDVCVCDVCVCVCECVCVCVMCVCVCVSNRKIFVNLMHSCRNDYNYTTCTICKLEYISVTVTPTAQGALPTIMCKGYVHVHCIHVCSM